jgi:acyl dehydratase
VTLLTDELRARIGETRSYTAPEELGRAAIRYFALAVGDDNPLYTDAEAARRVGYRDVVAPPTLICETNQYAGVPRTEDGYAGHEWDLVVPGTRLVRGGNSYTFERAIHPDDVVTASWTLTGIAERTNRARQEMLLVTSRAEYRGANGDLLATNEETLVYVATGTTA